MSDETESAANDPTDSAEEPKLGQDVFVALAAIGWADGKLDTNEADAIVRCALEEGLDLEDIEVIEKATKDPVDVGDIDISKMSKADRLFVYAVGSWIVRIDGHVADEEKSALEKLGVALKIPEKPRAHAVKIAEEIGELGESEEPAFYNLPKLRRTLKHRLNQARKMRDSQQS
jgi:uncharacterized membrane protein YebE (DUF533 family)